jgi:hypothetical protein
MLDVSFLKSPFDLDNKLVAIFLEKAAPDKALFMVGVR